MALGRQRQGEQSQRLLQALDSVGLALGCAFCIISSVPLLESICSGQDASGAESVQHTPSYNSILGLYPCNGSIISRGFFLFKHSPRLLKNLLSLRGPDFWLAVFLSFWLLLVASRICLPHQMYSEFAAPFLSSAARASPLVLFLAAGPAAPLSATAAQFLSRGQAFLDAIIFVTQPTRSVSTEAAFSVLSLAALGVLTSWHGQSHLPRPYGDNGGGGGGGGGGDAMRVLVAQVVLQRAALLVAVHWLAARLLYGSRRGGGGFRHLRQSSGSSRDAGGGGGRLLQASSPSVTEASSQPLLHPAPGLSGLVTDPPHVHEQLQQRPGQQQRQLGKTGAAVAAVAVAGPAAAAPATEYGKPPPAHVHQAHQARQEEHLAELRCGCEGSGVRSLNGSCERRSELFEAAAAAATGPAAAGAGCGALPMSPAIAYRSPIRRRAARIKIPFAEPDQISAGHVERLRGVAAERGMTLSGVYVREGCIELLLDIGEVALAAGTPEALGAAAAAADDPRVSDGNPVAGLSSVSDIEDILRALGLSVAATGPAEGQATSGVGVSAVRLGRGELLGGDGADVSCPRRISRPPCALQSISPRVLVALSPTFPAMAAAAAGGGTGGCGGGDTAAVGGDSSNGGGHGSMNGGRCQPRLPRLSVTVSRPAHVGAAVAAAGVESAASPSPPPPLEVLVRAQGTYLPCRAALRHRGGGSGGAAAAAATSSYDLYDLELLALPRYPGSVLVEFRWGGVLSRAVPLLVLNDAAVAAELQAASAQHQPGAAAAGAVDDADDSSTAVRQYDDSLDDLFLDMGALLTEAAFAAAPAATASSDAASASGAAETAAAPLRLSCSTAEALATHLLHQATTCGWTATADRIRHDMELIRRLAASGGSGGSGGGGVAASGGGDVGVGQARWRAVASGAAAAAAIGWVKTGSGRAAAAGGAAPVAARPRALLLTALLQAAGWIRPPQKEEAAYRAWAAPRVLAYGQVIQAVEVLSLLALLFRARRQLLDPGNLTSLIGCAVGTMTAAAWPLVPRRHWERLVEAAKLPRYLCYMAAKIMIGALGVPAPPAIVPYQLGPAMLVMEGVLLPFSCLLSPRTALALALLKWPLSVAMMTASGATPDARWATALCGRVVAAAVATTLASHTYLRYNYHIRTTTAAATAVAPAVGDGGAAACGGKRGGSAAVASAAAVVGDRSGTSGG